MTSPSEPKRPTPQDEINEREWANSECWKLGMFYYSEKDTRVWVPKRTMFGRQNRVGGTPNFAKPEARLYILVVTSILLGIMTVLVVMRQLGVMH